MPCDPFISLLLIHSRLLFYTGPEVIDSQSDFILCLPSGSVCEDELPMLSWEERTN